MAGALGPERALVGLAAIAGAVGVALAAAAAHVAAGPTLETSARFLLFHAPVLLALSAIIRQGLVHRRAGLAAGAALAVGLTLFSGDLAWRALLGSVPVPMAAPTGGTVLIGGWALLLAATVAAPRQIGG